MNPGLRVIHYLNQFFGGIGGEEKAFVGPQIQTGPINLGTAIQNELKEKGEIVATVICGDNTMAENTAEAIEEIIRMITSYRPDMVIAGPAFNAGRYGVACGEICKAVKDKLGIPAVTGMYDENPGVELYRGEIYIVKTAESVRGMPETVTRIVNLALKLAMGEKIGKPEDQGYFTRGIIRNELSDYTAAERAVRMVLAKIKGEPYASELEVPEFDRVAPAPFIENLTTAKIALVTDGGLVRKGNPEKMKSLKSTTFAVYNVDGLHALNPDDFEGNHIGYDTIFVDQDPNRLVPLDVVRDLEKEGVLGQLHKRIYSTAGVSTSLDNSRNIGRGIAEKLKADKVDGVILTST